MRPRRRDVAAPASPEILLDEENADGAYDRTVSGLKDCLPGAWTTTQKVDGVHARTTTVTGGTGPSLRVVSRDVSGDAYLVELWVDAPRR